MSQYFDNNGTSAKKFELKVKLEDSGNYNRWRDALQDKLFAALRNNNMDNLTSKSTLDPKYFKDHADFKAGWKEASKDTANNKVEPLSNLEFAGECFQHARTTGDGFEPWVYAVYAGVRESLCDNIKDQTAGVLRDDLVHLFSAIKLAVGHHEVADPYDLELEYMAATMETTGENDIMKFNIG
jgi:hypothetical protein